ncbi:hypothetical protein QN277_009509 [Acacia crassicarpa]|uniref:Retrotransposon Copia-like N-terminal domain-containing protein n=1 Tax=Acacia crassicarpa TaxID=499986 RepID=A0AAE1M5U3_9FABA|nr:hypothetical protein QN277_009509 [Acacia crassicarpa]
MAEKDASAKASPGSIPFSHPLYLHPSDTQGLSIIQQTLTGSENYTVGSRAMRIALFGKHKLGFVDGTCQKEDQDSAMQPQWERCNALSCPGSSTRFLRN